MPPNPESKCDLPVVVISRQRTLEKMPPPEIESDGKISTITKSVSNDVQKEDEKPRRSCLPSLGNWCHIVIFSIAEILAGFNFSLLAPFYSSEATSKGKNNQIFGILNPYSYYGMGKWGSKK